MFAPIKRITRRYRFTGTPFASRECIRRFPCGAQKRFSTRQTDPAPTPGMGYRSLGLEFVCQSALSTEPVVIMIVPALLTFVQ